MPPLSHEEVRTLTRQYRARAEEFCRAAREMDHGLGLNATPRANVQLCEGGAFVEVSLWVPREDLG